MVSEKKLHSRKFKLNDPLNFNIVDSLILKNINNGLGDKAAIISTDTVVTYQELFLAIQSIGQIEILSSIEEGSLVAVVFDNSLLSIIVTLGLINIGLVPCILNSALSYKEYDNHLSTINPRLVISNKNISNSFYHLIISSVDSLKLINKLLSLQKTNLGSWDRPAFCLFTSGTTGSPNAVVHRHKDIFVMNNDYAKHIIKVNEKDIFLSTSKMFFSYGLNAIFISLYHGATVVLLPSQFQPNEVWEMISKNSVSILFSVPAMYSRLLDHKESSKCPSLKICVSAGEALSRIIYEKWLENLSIKIVDGIGTTEIMSTFISNKTDDIKPGSTGKLVPGFKVDIKNEDGKSISKSNVPGILWVHGDTYLPEYLNNTVATKERFIDGWFKTNDIFSRDDHGYFYYHGRANDLIKCGGLWIYPARIENILNQHPAVNESVVVGKEQANGLLRPVAFVVLNKSYKANSDVINDLKIFCKAKCSSWEYPHFIEFISDIPKTATGKYKRTELCLIKT